MNGNNPIKIELVVPQTKFELKFSTPVISLDVGPAGNVPVLPNAYEGEYEVTSSITEQMLLTENKLMEQNLVIKAVPYDEVSNLGGGTTFYIGKEVE